MPVLGHQINIGKTRSESLGPVKDSAVNLLLCPWFCIGFEEGDQVLLGLSYADERQIAKWSEDQILDYTWILTHVKLSKTVYTGS